MTLRLAASWRLALLSATVAWLSAVPLASRAAASPEAAPTATAVDALSTSMYGSVLVAGGTVGSLTSALAGAPLYMFSGDAEGKFGCTTKLVPSAWDVGSSSYHAFQCTGPENAFDTDPTVDWPAFTTTGAPLAGPGVDRGLLGTVNRPGIGRQVTYGGHPLYFFDAAAEPFNPQGENFLEPVEPLPPWHGLWDLVSAHGGQPAPGPATIQAETLPDGKTAVASIELLNTITVYSFSRDHAGVSYCTGACAVIWIPVLTTGRPHVGGGVAAKDVGVIRRADGTDQVTYDGKPLYLYSAEKVNVHNSIGTAGNGNGLAGPRGGTFSVVLPG